MNREIKKVEYDEWKCLANSEAICPYCGCENYIEPETYKGQDEETIEECGNCGKTFVHQIDYNITFSSEPYENWVLREINNYEGQIKNLEELKNEAPVERNKGLNKEYYQSVIDYHQRELDKLLKQAEKVLKNVDDVLEV